MFSKLSSVKTYDQSKYFQEGQYLAEITRVKLNEGGYKGDSFVIETTIRAAISDHDAAPDVGESAAHVWSASGDKRELGLSNWKAFLKAAFGIDEAEKRLTDSDWEELSNGVIEDDLAVGKLMRLECWMKQTKSGNPFTMHKWLREATDADRAEFGLK
jgi:hypothetical protein